MQWGKCSRYLFLRKEINVNKSPDPSEIYILPLVLQDARIVFDVGAQDCEYLVNNNPTISFHLFEPNPKFYDELYHSFNMGNIEQSQIRLNKVGLGNAPKVVQYYSDTESICKRTHHTTSRATPFEISISTLDIYCSQNDVHYIDFLKIDTEGYELEVLQGSQRMLHNIHFIQFEYGGTYLDMQIKLKDVYNLLEDWYIYLMHSNYLELMEEPLENFEYSNYLACRHKIKNEN